MLNSTEWIEKKYKLNQIAKCIRESHGCYIVKNTGEKIGLFMNTKEAENYATLSHIEGYILEVK